jgi:tetratricopeptide (TPR) repeat protein
MKVCFLNLLVLCVIVLSAATLGVAQSQLYSKIADDSITYLKAGTFGKPSVAKKTSKLAMAQVRVHFKVVTTSAVETRDNGAKVSVYLDGAMTNADLQKLTDEFYANLQRKLSALGISFVDWQAIQATEYYKKRAVESDKNKRTDADAKNGQAWASYTAFDGPVIIRTNPLTGFADELLSYGKAKSLSKMSEEAGGDLVLLDALVDFTTVNLNTNVGTIWEEDGKYKEYTAGGNVGEMMSIPMSYVLFYDQKNGFDQYKSKLPVAIRGGFANRIYQDDAKAALKTRTYFGDTRFTFTPRVVEVDRERYLTVARRALDQYADLFVEKMRLIRSGEKPKDGGKQIAASERNPNDTSLEKVKDEAKKNNTTSAVTFDENMSAAKQAIAEKKWNLAADYLGAAIKIEPDNFQLYLERGVIYMNQLQNYKAAIADFTKALELKPQEITALYNRGSAYVQLQDFKKAVKDLDAFIAQKSDMPEAYLNRGIALLNTKKTDEAIEDFNRGMQLNPRYPNLYRARAIAYKIKGNATMAQADELRAAQLEQGQ